MRIESWVLMFSLDSKGKIKNRRQFFDPTEELKIHETVEKSMGNARVHRAATMRTLFAALLCFWSNLVPAGEAIWLSIPPSSAKCISEEMHSNVVVLGDYVVVPEDHLEISPISVKVSSPYRDNLHQKQNVTQGQFAFTTHVAGSYLACFGVDSPIQGGKNVIVNVDWKIGITAKDWDSVAKKENIEGVELELRKLEGSVDAIHDNILYLKSREADMRIASEATNAKVVWFSTVSLGVCVVVSVLQIVYLKQFFQKKKLI